MEHPLVITSKNTICDKPAARWLSDAIHEAMRFIDSQPLTPQTIFMNKIDYDDLMAWTK